MKIWIIAFSFALSPSAAGQLIWTIVETGHTSSVRSVAFSPDGSQLASMSSDNTIRLWNVATGREVRRFEEYRLYGNSVVFSPYGTQLAFGLGGNWILLLDVVTGQELRRFGRHRGSVNSVAFSPDGTQLASGSGGTIYLWDVAMGQEVRRFHG
ncbi:MAG: hypothetical protein F4221_07630, partial [Rhodothermaceae bacterium]|nr:hypothetical protein [Rhodothermaceae bacterium]